MRNLLKNIKKEPFLVLFCVISLWFWIITPFVDVRMCVGGLVGSAVYVVFRLLFSHFKNLRCIVSYVISIIIAIGINLFFCVSFLRASVCAIGMVLLALVAIEMYTEIIQNK